MKILLRLTLALLLLLTVTSVVLAQTKKAAATWTFALSKPSPVAGDEVEIVLSAKLAPGWSLYASDFQAEIGPQPTRVVLTPNDAFSPVGSLRSVGAKRKRDRTWDLDLGYFEERAGLRQTIRVLRPGLVIAGEIRGQLCSGSDGTCELMTERFSVSAR